MIMQGHLSLSCIYFVVCVLHVDYAYLSSTYVDKDQYEDQYLPGMIG